MALTPGARVGPYEVTSQIGRGGMGEVYRALDNSLGRQVAIKILPDAFAHDPQRAARFEREAKTLAALNHPHIAQIYGFERTAGGGALVMELVEGETLADRLAHGTPPVMEALTIARQVADAIEAAHARGVVHRDLKPANIKITPGGLVKVLDFGLAKSVGDAVFQDQLPTVAEVTLEGTIVGTAAYMSPQQARGEAVERDADIWAFGCVLYELLTGSKAFGGATTSDTIANVLQREPDWTTLPPSTPSAAIRLARRCLMKDPAKRLRDIADARFEIEDLLAGGATPSAGVTAPHTSARPLRGSRWLAVSVVAALVLGLAAGMLMSPRLRGGTSDAPAHASVFAILEPPGNTLYLFTDPIKISPDGRQIALITNGADGQSHLWLRSLDGLEPRRLEDADSARSVFWSPDGRSLAFVARGQLRVLDLVQKSARPLVSVSAGPTGGTWNRQGTILFADGFNGLKQIPAAGGTATPVAAPGPHGDTTLVGAPQFLPDGRHFLYVTAGKGMTDGVIMLGDLDSPSRSAILSTNSLTQYAPPGHLLYVRNGELVAHGFDTTTFQVTGDPAVVGRGLWLSGLQVAFSASETGVLAFATQRIPETQLAWVDRSGKAIGSLGEPGLWIHTAISPDEKTVAAERLDSRTGFGVIWAIDVARNVASRVTDGSAWALAPIWSPRGDRVVFTSGAAAPRMAITSMPADGSGRMETIVPDVQLGTTTDWLPGERGLVFHQGSTDGGGDLWTVTLGADRKPTPLLQTSFQEGFGKVSPDGRWLAYASDESGRGEIYVRPLDGGGRWRISQSGGSQARWRRDGRELYFLSEAGRIMAAPINAGSAFDAGVPVDLSIETERDITGSRYVYDVADLGRRFLVIRRTTREVPPPITVTLNWPALAR